MGNEFLDLVGSVSNKWNCSQLGFCLPGDEFNRISVLYVGRHGLKSYQVQILTFPDRWLHGFKLWRALAWPSVVQREWSFQSKKGGQLSVWNPFLFGLSLCLVPSPASYTIIQVLILTRLYINHEMKINYSLQSLFLLLKHNSLVIFSIIVDWSQL